MQSRNKNSILITQRALQSMRKRACTSYIVRIEIIDMRNSIHDNARIKSSFTFPASRFQFQEPPVCLKLLALTVYCAQHSSNPREDFRVTIMFNA